MRKQYTIKYDLFLLLTAIIWGTGFIGVHFALETGLPTGMIVTLRMIFGALFMLPFSIKGLRSISKKQVLHGVIAGIFLSLATVIQTVGLQYTTVSNNAFLTTTNVIFVPFICWLVFKKRPALKTFIAVAVGFLGMSILTRVFDTTIQFNIGDILTLISAVLFASHIVYVAYASADTNPSTFTFIQLLTSALVGFVYMLVAQSPLPSWQPEFGLGILATVYLGIFCTALAFFLQCYAQQHTPPSKVALILSLESVSASVFSILLGLEPLQPTLMIGGGIIMLSIVLLQWKGKRSQPDLY